MKSTLSIIVVLALFFIIPTVEVEAGVFAKYDGIDGESKDENHDKWIDVFNEF